MKTIFTTALRLFGQRIKNPELKGALTEAGAKLMALGAPRSNIRINYRTRSV